MKFLACITFFLYGFTCQSQNGLSFQDLAILSTSNPRGGLSVPTLIRTGTNTSAALPTSLTISGFDCTGGNYMLIAVGTSTSANRTVSSITSGTGGQTATNIVTVSYIGALNGKAILYGIVNPTTGNVVVTMSGATTTMSITAMLFNNVGGSGATGAGTAGSDFSGSIRTSISDNLTTLSTDLAVDSLVYNATIGNPTSGGSQTIIAETTGSASLGFVSNSTQSGAVGTTTMGWSFSSQVVTWVGVVLNGK